MATHSSILAWNVPQTKEPHGLQSMGLQRFGHELWNHFCCFCSVMSYICDPMDCNTPGLPVLHQLPEFVQTHVHWIGDPIQLSHPLSSLSPFTFNLSQHQGSFPMNWLFVSKYWRPKCWCPKYWSFGISPSNVNHFYFLLYYQRRQISRSPLSHESTQFLINVSLNPAF